MKPDLRYCTAKIAKKRRGGFSGLAFLGDLGVKKPASPHPRTSSDISFPFLSGNYGDSLLNKSTPLLSGLSRGFRPRLSGVSVLPCSRSSALIQLSSPRGRPMVSARRKAGSFGVSVTVRLTKQEATTL
jgi:hypothetical protein